MQEIDPLFVRNLSAHAPFSSEERTLITTALSTSVRDVPAKQDIVREGDVPRSVKIVIEGWVARYKELPDGHRQILALMVPGDICDANAFILEKMDHSLGTLTHVRYAEIFPNDFEVLITSSPNIAKALWRSKLVTLSIQREWTLNIGQRQAKQRIAHLLCEMATRLSRIGLSTPDSCEFPLTQAQIGEATGLTVVHVNRVLQEMKAAGLAELRDRRLYLLNMEGLYDLAMFNRAYLHVQ